MLWWNDSINNQSLVLTSVVSGGTPKENFLSLLDFSKNILYTDDYEHIASKRIRDKVKALSNTTFSHPLHVFKSDIFKLHFLGAEVFYRPW